LRAMSVPAEHDLPVSNEAYWGVHTLRAVQNFPITGVPVRHLRDFVVALAVVKQAAAARTASSACCPPTRPRRSTAPAA
jgi:aspartate ammonia-lyase